MVNPTINKDEDIRFGMFLTENVNLNVLTCGDHRGNRKGHDGTMSSALPDMTTAINPEEALKNWQIVQNLQATAEKVIEPLIAEYRKIKIFRGYQNPRVAYRAGHDDMKYNKHYTGEAVDIYLPDMIGNMYHLMPEFQKILKGNFVEMGLVFSNMSWIHIGINANYGPNQGDTKNPTIYTLDLSREEKYFGVHPLRGLHI